MLGIFEDEWRENGPISSNPLATGCIWPLDVVAKDLKWPALLRLSRHTSGQMHPASTATLIDDTL